MRKNNLSNFRIFAIRPLPKCDEQILKVLKEDEIYYLFSDYQLEQDETLIYKKSYPEHLYDAFKLRMNICAIAGKNGSGKSSLIELLLMGINNIAHHFKIKDDLQPVVGLKVALYIQAGMCYKVSIDGEELSIEHFDILGKLKQGDGAKLGLEKLKGLFYTICMNYSHYAYNYRDYVNEHQTDWLSPLFHKNDAYQTPLVINPWRDNGDIIIARENSLVQSRLIANLLRPNNLQSDYNFRNIAENLRAHALQIKLNRNKVFDSELYRRPAKANEKAVNGVFIVTYKALDKLNKEDILRRINKIFDFGYQRNELPFDEMDELAMEYLVKKLVSISVKYDEYKGYFLEQDDNFDYKKIGIYIKRITRDRTHIGFKFRQTLNFLKHRHINLDPKNLTLESLSEGIQKIINEKVNYRDTIIELIPPPIFSIDILLKPISGSGADITVKTLSSGEKQMIYSLSSVLYHLFNLDSVSTKTRTKIHYRAVHIILEEIELYFHPEMQRRYLKFLRESIIHLGLSNIHDISICFVTHSPFILSDIPDANILFLQLKDGKSVQVNRFRKTFAANIHDLLADVFFMQNGVCGAFAIEEIHQTINFLNNSVRRNEIIRQLFNDPKNEELLNELEVIEFDLSGESAEDHELLIENIGEPVIKRKLQEMYNEAFPDDDRKKKILAEISRLQKLLTDN